MKRKSVKVNSSHQFVQRLSAKFDSPRKTNQSSRKPDVKSILSNLGNFDQMKESETFSEIFSLPLGSMKDIDRQEPDLDYETIETEEVNFFSKYLAVEKELNFLETDSLGHYPAKSEASLPIDVVKDLKYSSSTKETILSGKKSLGCYKYEPMHFYAIMPDPDNLQSMPILLDKNYRIDGQYEDMNDEEQEEYGGNYLNERQSLLKQRILNKLDEQEANSNLELHFKKFSVRKFLETQRITNPNLMEEIVTEEKLNLSKLTDMHKLFEKNPGVFGEGLREKDRVDNSFSVSNILSSSRTSKSKAATFFKSLNN